MPSAYPGAYDSFNNPSDADGDNLDTPGVEHDEQHANANDAIEAVQAELGLHPSGSSLTVRARLDAADATHAADVADLHADLANLNDEVDYDRSFSLSVDTYLSGRIDAMDSELGLNPSGIHDSVATRLNLLEGGISGFDPDNLSDILLALSNNLGNALNIRPLLTDPFDPSTTTAEINDAIQTLSEAGGGEIYFKAGDYYIGLIDPEVDEPWWDGGIRIWPNVSLYGEPGARLLWADPVAINYGTILTNMDGFPETPVDLPIIEPIDVGDDTFWVGSADGLSIGDDVMLRIGQNPYDPAEVKWWTYAKVIEIIPAGSGDPGDSVRLDRRSPEALDPDDLDPYTSQSTAAPRRFVADGCAMIRKLDPARWCDGLRISGLELGSLNPVSGMPGSGFAFYNARNIRIDNLVLENVNGSSMNYCQGAFISNFRIRRSNAGGSEVYLGRGVSFAACQNFHGVNWNIEACTQHALMLEADCRDFEVRGIRLVDNHEDHDAEAAMMSCGHRCDIRLDGVVLESIHEDWSPFDRGTYGNLNPGTSRLELRNTVIVAPATPIAFPLWALVGGTTRFETIVPFPTGSPDRIAAVATFGPPQSWATTALLTPNMDGDLPLPDGIIRRFEIFTTTSTGITSLTYSNAGSTDVDIKDGLVPGAVAIIGDDRLWEIGGATGTPAIDVMGRFGYQNVGSDQSIGIVTDGTVPSGSYIQIKISYLPLITDDGEPMLTAWHGSVQKDFASIIYDLVHSGTHAGFYGAAPVERPTAAANVNDIHAALVSLGLIEAP